MCKTEQNAEKTGLTKRQQRAIPILLTSPTYTDAAQKARIGRNTLYGWLKDPAFKAELERQRDEITEEAYGLLSQNLTKAVEVLTTLLDDSDKKLKRLAAKDILDFFVKHIELKAFEERLEAIEESLDSKR